MQGNQREGAGWPELTATTTWAATGATASSGVATEHDRRRDWWRWAANGRLSTYQCSDASETRSSHGGFMAGGRKLSAPTRNELTERKGGGEHGGRSMSSQGVRGAAQRA